MVRASVQDGTPEATQARAMVRTRAANGNFKLNDKHEKMQFYYHPDHLGSSSTSPTTTETKDGKMPKNLFIMDEIVISAPKSTNVNPNNDNNETHNK